MAVLLLIAAAALGVPLLGVALALVQLGIYRGLANLGRLPRNQVPWFGFLWLRGMAAAVVILAVLAVASRTLGGAPTPAPPSDGTQVR